MKCSFLPMAGMSIHTLLVMKILDYGELLSRRVFSPSCYNHKMLAEKDPEVTCKQNTSRREFGAASVRAGSAITPQKQL